MAIHRLQKFDSNGSFITKWGSFGYTNGEFNSPRFVSVDSSNNIYVTDSGNHRIQKFGEDGILKSEWSGDFGYLEGIAIDPQNKIHVVDRVNNCIQVFEIPM